MTVWSSKRERSPTIVVLSPPYSGALTCAILPLTRITKTTRDSGSPALVRVTVAVVSGQVRPATLTSGSGWGRTQSGVMVWNDAALTPPLLDAVFPALAATHQVNRVAALAAAAAELLEFGPDYMAAVVPNAQTLAQALDARGVPTLGAHKGYTTTHQVIADVRQFGGGLTVAHRLAEANIITNKNLLPHDTPQDWDRPSGLRIGTTEVTRLGMGEVEMRAIADMIAGVLVEGRDPEHVRAEAIELRAAHQQVGYCFD